MRRGSSGWLPACALLLLLAPAPAAAKILYINPVTGNDATSYERNSSATPWRSIGRAAWGSTSSQTPNPTEAARAGDVVLVAAGTYAVAGTNSRNVPAYNPVNQGHAGSPITFRAEGKVTLTLSSSSGTVIGSMDRDYIVWDGFTLNEAAAPSNSDTGSVTIWACNGCAIVNCDIDGGGDANGRRDNHTGIRIESSSNVVIRNNRIRNVHTAHNVNNGAAIQTYSSGGIVFEHNDISNSGSGIFIKGGPPGNPKNDYFTIRYNHIYDIGTERGGSAVILHVGAGNRPEAPTLIYGNLIRNAREAGIKIWMFDGRDPTMNPMNSKTVNNTIIGSRYGVWVTGNLIDGAGHVFHNNIVSTAMVAVQYEGAAANLTKARLDLEHNIFHRVTQFAVVAARHTFASWRSTFGQDTAQPETSDRDPRFVDAARLDFRLQPQSAALETGIDLLDLNKNGRRDDRIPAGAYVTGAEIIGRLPES
jgi:hypothetical protein